MSSPKDFETFEEYKDTLPKEPTDPNSKKEYIVGCFTPDDWTYIHQVLLEDGTIEDNIPPQTVDCVDNYKHSPVRGRYLLNDSEAEKLRNHEKVEYVSLNTAKYPGTHAIDPVLLRDVTYKQDRYSSTVKHFKDHSSNSNAFNSTASSHKNRTGYQQLRCQQKTRFWSNDSVVFDNKGAQYGTGEGVDVIVCDEDAWFGHIEFQNNLGGPQNYVGGNPLPGNGTCDLIDLILEAPYYLDPDFFNGDASKRESRWDGTTVPTEAAARAWWSTERANYAGHGYTIKITDASNSSNFKTFTITDNGGVLFLSGVLNRQSFSYNNTPVASGGTLPSTGAVTIEFTRTGSGTWNSAASYGPFPYNLTTSNDNPTSGTINEYNSNTIFLNRVDSNGTDRSSVFNSSSPYNIDVVSPVTNGTRSAKFVGTDVTGGTATGVNNFGPISISSTYNRDVCNGKNTAYKSGTGYHGTPCASQAYGRQYGWAYNANKFYLNLYGTGNQGTEKSFDIIKIFHQIKPINSTYGNQNPTITSNSFGYRPLYQATSGYYWYRPSAADGTVAGVEYSNSDGSLPNRPEFLNYFTQTGIRSELKPCSMLTAGVEMIDAGVIMCCSAGNTNQKLVGATHPDYNNYINNSDNTALLSTNITTALPDTTVSWYKTTNRQGFPAQVGQQGTGSSRIYRTICVGALDSADRLYNTGQEQKASYSNMGELIDCYAPGLDTLSACDNRTGTSYNLSGVRYNRNDAYYTIDGDQSVESEDRIFGGTSAATPVACGIIATKLQYNRTWTWMNVKNWLSGQVGTQSTSDFYHGTEETSPTASGWSDQDAVHDSDVTVIWDALTTNKGKLSLFGGNCNLSGNLQIT